MTTANNFRAAAVPDAVLAASRQVWLAGLGAAVVTREWADKEAGTMFRKLVREGTVVESRAFRIVGERLDTSFSQANVFWQRARRTVATTAKSLAEVTTSLVRQAMPASLPGAASKKVARPSAKRPAKRARKAVPVSAPAKRRTRSAKRSVKGS
jgi:hypothetical protein